MKQDGIHKIGAIALASSALSLHSNSALAQTADDEIVNIANLSYQVGDTQFSMETNAAVFTVQRPQVAPTIEFFRYAPTAGHAQQVNVNGSDFSPSGSLAGPFNAVSGATNTGNNIDFSGAVPLIPATSFLSGELIFVQVTDASANQDPNSIETIVIDIEIGNGDAIVLRLYESGPDTGEFWGFAPSTTSNTSKYDGEITTGSNEQLVATYQGSNTLSEIVVDSALIDPANIVFDSVSGAPINGAQITLMDMQSHGMASVYGVDGFSHFPSAIVSGETITDESGLNYVNTNGEFQFPLLQPGEYYVEVVPPEGYRFASVLTPDFINQTTGAGYFIIEASYGRPIAVNSPGALRFDIPLDPESDLVITKTADRTAADIGDFVGYTVSIENNGTVPTPIRLFDTLPVGFRYIEGTSRQGANFIDDPEISETADALTFPLGLIGPGESVQLNYALEIGPGAALGDAVNRAVVRDADGNQLSNVARAAVKLREDLMRSHSTIVGRVSENACDTDEDWAREILTGEGVEGVRLYMETGAYAVTDAQGLYHFEGVTGGTHVVQVDEGTLPKGYEPVLCEDNTRYAGNTTSKFIDIQGGGIWRANFYLERTGEVEETKTVETFNDTTEYKDFDQAWLDQQTDEIEWVYPDTELTPSKPSVNLGIKHPVGTEIDILLNGRKVPGANLMSREFSTDRTKVISHWRGVDILPGRNEFVATVTDRTGRVVQTLRNEISFVTNIARVRPLPDQSKLVADGRTVPTVAIRLEDEAGRPVHAGRIATIDVQAPYRLYDETGERELSEKTQDYIAPLSARMDTRVGPNGTVKINLEPTLQTGKVTVIVTLDSGRQVPVHMYLEPEKRDWIIVGLAEGSIGYQTIKDKAVALAPGEDNETIRDGRVAFFAKGLIRGDWLMTLAVDTDKRRGGRDGDFLSEIDPNAYYTLYGDRSYQQYEALSRYPVFVKLEKRTASALFGDFNTDITEGRLTSYNRRLSGLRAEYVGQNFHVMGFAAETNQGFAKDEIPADGTSGTYRLSNGNVLAQSENIVIETRDRNRPDIVLERREMIRYLDYTLDYLTGELIFRLPVDASDDSFNPNVIVVDYETSEEAERNVTFGGRVQADLADGRVRVGSTFVQQNGSALSSGSKENMVGVDMVADVTDNTEVRLEYAMTEDKTGVDGETREAVLAEVIHTSDKISAEAYFREEDGGFGLGQQNSNTNGIRRYGASVNVKIDEYEDEETGRRGQRTLQSKAYHEDNLGTGNSRDTAEVTLRQTGEKLNVSGGLRVSRDKLVNQADRKSVLALAQASYKLPEQKATLTAAIKQPIGGKDAVTNYPRRITVGADKMIGSKTTATIRHEILDGANASGQNTVVGLSTSPWTGATVTASSDLITGDNSRRLGATIGVDQQYRINERWSLSAGLRNRRVLDENGTYVDVAPDAAISPLEVNQDFTSAYLGAAYRKDHTSGSARIETRQASDGETWIGTVGVAREMSEKLSVAGAGRVFTQNPDDPASGSTTTLDARVGAAWRPRNNDDLILLNRTDVSHEKDRTGAKRTRFVNNVSANVLVDDNWQLAGHYGIKHVRQDIAGLSLKSTNHLFGAETRYDLTKNIDLGLRGSVLTNGRETKYSIGPQIGFSPTKDVWISAGYNVDGFEDDDFEATEYSRKGVYIQMKLKFDQNTARGLLRRISPQTVAGPAHSNPQAFSQPTN